MHGHCDSGKFHFWDQGSQKSCSGRPITPPYEETMSCIMVYTLSISHAFKFEYLDKFENSFKRRLHFEWDEYLKCVVVFDKSLKDIIYASITSSQSVFARRFQFTATDAASSYSIYCSVHSYSRLQVVQFRRLDNAVKQGTFNAFCCLTSRDGLVLCSDARFSY